MTATSPYRAKSAFCGPRSLPSLLSAARGRRVLVRGERGGGGTARPCAEGWGRRSLGRELLLRDAASASSPRGWQHPPPRCPDAAVPPGSPRGFSVTGRPKARPVIPSRCSGLGWQRPARSSGASPGPSPASAPRLGAPARPTRFPSLRTSPPAPSCALFKAVEQLPPGHGGVPRPEQEEKGRKKGKPRSAPSAALSPASVGSRCTCDPGGVGSSPRGPAHRPPRTRILCTRGGCGGSRFGAVRCRPSLCR